MSVPTSRWFTIDALSAWRISIGSSIVTMCLCWVSLMWSIIEPSVVVFPEPVGPVTSTRPRSCSASFRTTGGRPSSSNDGISLCTRRSTRPTEPRWRITLTRKRPTPETEYAKSASLVAMNSSARCLGIIANAMRSVSTGETSAWSSRSRRPSIRMKGGEPTFR